MDSNLGVGSTIKEVYDLINADRKPEAKQLVWALFQQDKTNPDILYLAAYFSELPENKIKLLERILTINPNHPQANQILTRIRQPLSLPRPYAFDLDGLLVNLQGPQFTPSSPKSRFVLPDISPTGCVIIGLFIGLFILITILVRGVQ